MIVEEMVVHFLFDDRKVNQHARKPTAEELLTLLEVETTAPTLFDPSGSTHLQPQREKIKKSRSKRPVEEWRKRLSLAPDDVINHSLDKKHS